MIKKSDFPKKLYVYIKEDGKKKFFISCVSPRECDSLTESRLVGIYNLEKIGKLLVAEGVMVKP